jgi:hypothetical protein
MAGARIASLGIGPANAATRHSALLLQPHGETNGCLEVLDDGRTILYF